MIGGDIRGLGTAGEAEEGWRAHHDRAMAELCRRRQREIDSYILSHFALPVPNTLPAPQRAGAPIWDDVQ